MERVRHYWFIRMECGQLWVQSALITELLSPRVALEMAVYDVPGTELVSTSPAETLRIFQAWTAYQDSR